MKFQLQTTFFLAMAASVSSQSSSNSTAVLKCPGSARTFIPPACNIIAADGIGYYPCALLCSNGYSQTKRCNNEHNRRKLEERREKHAGRRLQDASGPVSPPDNITIKVTDGAVVLLEANVGAATSALFKVTTIHGDVLTLTATEGEEIHAGVAKVGLVSMEDTLDVQDVYTWIVEVDGEQVGPRFSFNYDANGEDGDGGRRLNQPAFISEGSYPFGGQSQEATGRIYFTVDVYYPDWDNWYATDFACTGTAIKDNKTGRSVILTAAHCIWEDEYTETFGYNAVFIPNRDATTSQLDSVNIHRECSEDPCGCWTLSGGIVHKEWTETIWPDSLAWDYGFWVVNDVGSHTETICNDSTALDIAVPASTFVVGVPEPIGQQGTAQGYSIEKNPDFRYCSDIISEINPHPDFEVKTLWMDTCGLSGGASGGPWSLDFDTTTGSGTIFTVNSWSYTSGTGMGAPRIDPSLGRCLMNFARQIDIKDLEWEYGYGVDCDRPCLNPDGTPARRLRGESGERQLCNGEEQK